MAYGVWKRECDHLEVLFDSCCSRNFRSRPFHLRMDQSQAGLTSRMHCHCRQLKVVRRTRGETPYSSNKASRLSSRTKSQRSMVALRVTRIIFEGTEGFLRVSLTVHIILVKATKCLGQCYFQDQSLSACLKVSFV